MSTLGSIYRSFVGLSGFSSGLDTLSSNVANMNTTGYKGQSLQYSEIDNQMGDAIGVQTGNQRTNFSQGEIKSSGSATNLAINGDGFFVLKTPSGLVYTRNGDFEFGKDGYFVSHSTGYRVQKLIGPNRLGDIKLDKFSISPARPTTEVNFSGNLSPTASPGDVFPSVSSSQTISFKIFDASGSSESATVNFTRLYYDPSTKRLSATLSSPTYITVPGSDDSVFWKVSVIPPTGATANLKSTDPISFNNIIAFRPDGQSSSVYNSVNLNYTFSGKPADLVQLSLVFGHADSATVVSDVNNPSSNIAVSKNDGRAIGSLLFSKTKIDQDGSITAIYSNSDSKIIGKVALAAFRNPDSLKRMENSLFIMDPNSDKPVFGIANHGLFGSIESGKLESSNVDLSTSFAEIVILQRGYQASSQLLTTTSKMLEDLYNSTKG